MVNAISWKVKGSWGTAEGLITVFSQRRSHYDLGSRGRVTGRRKSVSKVSVGRERTRASGKLRASRNEAGGGLGGAAMRSDGAKVVGTGGVTEGLVDLAKELGFIQRATGNH